MNLLPKFVEDFSSEDYWNTFFKQRGGKAFEWYGEYLELSEHLHKYAKMQDEILITGCGNSTLGRDLYDIGYRKITNIDISQVVIRQMQSQSEKERPELKYLQMDALDMSFADDCFSVVIDKGTLDALMPNEEAETQENIQKYFLEIQRVLRFGGRYVCISLLQEHILRTVLTFFPTNNWMFRAVRCFDVEKKAVDSGQNTLPVFLVVCTKFKALPRMILELNLDSSDRMQRYEKTEDVTAQIASTQQAAFVCSSLRRSSMDAEEEIKLDLYKSGSGSDTPRFTVYVVDVGSSHRLSKFAAFIVPQGREAEWLFSTKAGRRHLLKMTNHNRLAIVTMHRGQQYGSFEMVQNELEGAIRNLSPAGMSAKIPFLSLGADMGARTIRLEGSSKFSGDYVVEDVEVNNEKFRRLFYLSSQLVIQSEAKLKTIKTRKGPKEVVDLTHLTCRHHVYMSIATHVACQKQRSTASVVVIGLGGGGLCSFLHKFLPKVKITGVDIDGDMLKVATNWFGLKQDDRMDVVITDGLKFLEDSAKNGRKMEAVLFDVDSKDTTIGMSCPPKQFLEEGVLKNIVKIIGDSGFFILNMVQRDNSLRPEVLQQLKNNFKTILSYKLDEDLNEILICTRSASEKVLKENLVTSSKELNAFFKKNNSKRDCDVEIDSYMKSLKLV